jgi:hypothetical protein
MVALSFFQLQDRTLQILLDLQFPYLTEATALQPFLPSNRGGGVCVYVKSLQPNYYSLLRPVDKKNT